ncbi:cadmium resistance protein [Acrasis kona]|uniref:Cadmium resistance protein n=1 Tax=Acrasis kona TaxID=1008807 RepID=A0AAW2YM00_9EUKA
MPNINKYIPYKDKPGLVKQFLATLPYSARFMVINGKWQNPKFNHRKLKGLKLAADYHGLPFPNELLEKKKPELDNPAWYSKHGFIKPFKGDSLERKHDKRIDDVVETLKTMPTKLEKLRQDEMNRRYQDFMDLGLYGKVQPNTNMGKLVYGAKDKKGGKSKNNAKKKK